MTKRDALKMLSMGNVNLGQIRSILKNVNADPNKPSTVNPRLTKGHAWRILNIAIQCYKDIPDSHIMGGNARLRRRDRILAENIIKEFGFEGIEQP